MEKNVFEIIQVVLNHSAWSAAEVQNDPISSKESLVLLAPFIFVYNYIKFIILLFGDFDHGERLLHHFLKPFDFP